MSDLLDKLHADAVLGLLHTALDPVPISVYDGLVPDPLPDPAATPWVLVYVEGEWPVDGTGNTLDGKAITYLTRAYCHATAASAAGARAVAGQVRAALLNVKPSVAGRVTGFIRWAEGQPPNRDETLGFPVMDKVDIYEFVSTG